MTATVETEKNTFEITLPTFFESEFDSKIKSLNSKCKRHKLSPVVVNKGKVFIKEIAETFVDEATQTSHKTGKVVKYPCIPVTVEFEEIRVEGNWRVIASVEMLDDTEFQVINGCVDNTSKYKDIDFTHCDHCGVKRSRKKIIILENPESETKLVGRTCVKDYLGISPAALVCNLDLFAWLNKMASLAMCDPDENGSGWGSQPKYASLLSFAEVVVAVMRENKWQYVKKPMYYDEVLDGLTPTSISVDTTYGAIYDRHDKTKREDVVTPEDTELAEKVLKVLEEQYPESKLEDDLNSFEYNVVVMMATDKVIKPAIFCGAMCRPILQIVNPEPEKKVDVSKSEFFGFAKEKVELEVVWDRFKWIESSYSYGSSDVLICTGHVNGTNNIVTWFSNNEGGDVVTFEDEDFPKVDGEVVKIKATIKGHKDNGKYGNATLLNRVKRIK